VGLSSVSQMARPVYVKTWIIPSNFNQNLCPWSSLYFLKSYSVDILWTNFYIFFAVIASTQKSKKKRLIPAVNARKYVKPPHNICCVLLLTNWYIQGSAFIYWLMSAKHSSVAYNMFPINLIVEVKCQNWFQKQQPKENCWRQ
jgi:hypothetical protein